MSVLGDWTPWEAATAATKWAHQVATGSKDDFAFVGRVASRSNQPEAGIVAPIDYFGDPLELVEWEVLKRLKGDLPDTVLAFAPDEGTCGSWPVPATSEVAFVVASPIPGSSYLMTGIIENGAHRLNLEAAFTGDSRYPTLRFLFTMYDIVAEDTGNFVQYSLPYFVRYSLPDMLENLRK